MFEKVEECCKVLGDGGFCSSFPSVLYACAIPIYCEYCPRYIPYGISQNIIFPVL